MRKIEKLLSVILTLSMLIGMCPLVVPAGAVGADDVCQIGSVGYTSLAAAVADANENDIIWMIADDATVQQIEIAKSLTIELQGKALPSTTMKITGSETSVVLSDRVGTASINTSNAAGFAISEHSSCIATIYITGGASLTINGVTGTTPESGTVIRESCESNGRNLIKALFLGNGNLTINGATIVTQKGYSGKDALFVCDGTVTINDCYIYANASISYYNAPSEEKPLIICKGKFDGATWIENPFTINGVDYPPRTQSLEVFQNVFLSSSVGSTITSDSTYNLITVTSKPFANPNATNTVLPDGTKLFAGSTASTSEVQLSTGDNVVLELPILGGDGTTITYEWKKNDEVIPGATYSRYEISSISEEEHEAVYTVTATQGENSVTSEFMIVIDGLPRSHMSHSVCGDAVCTHDGHSSVDYTAIPADYTGGNLSGNYYLDRDISLYPDPIVVPRGEVLNLCLNGHVIRRGDWKCDVNCIRVYGTLNLCDCNTTATHEFGYDDSVGKWALVNENGIYSLTGGVITNVNSDNSSISAIAVGGYDEEGSCAGTLNMYGGNIVGNRSAGGSGVSVSEDGSVFNMYGGRICGNSSKNNGTVVASATVNMYGGEISDNRSSHGAGVFVNSTFNMYGGEIKNNTATSCGGGAFINRTFNMYGGEIKNNTTAQYGGGQIVK